MAIVARKGGVGKSTLAVLLGRAYARSGARVCLVDLDPQATASRVLAEPAADGGQALGERLLEGQAMDPLLIPTVVEGVQMVPSGDALSIHETRIASDQFGVPSVCRSVQSILSKGFDLVLVDTPPSLGPFTFGSLMAANWALIPTVCEDTSVQALPTALKAVARARRVNASLRMLGVVANRMERRTRHGAAALTALQAALGDLLATTIIPKAAAIPYAMKPGCPLDDSTDVAVLLSDLAGELLRRMELPPAPETAHPSCNALVAVKAVDDLTIGNASMRR